MLENKLCRMIGGLMKSRKIMIIVASIAVLLSIGGCTVKHKDNTKQGKTIATSSTKDLEEDKEAVKKKQLDYLKEHEQEIVDLIKAQNSKVESVQIDWEQTQWSDGGLTNPEYYINVFGRINNIKDSSWGIDIPINDDGTVNLEEMAMGNYIRIGGEPIE